MTRARTLGLALVLALPLGCATSTEEAGLESKREQLAPAPTDTEVLEAPAEDSRPPNRDLAELQRELQSNEADLRRLGVAIPSADGGDGETTTTSGLGTAETKQERKPSGGAGRDRTPTAGKTKKGTSADKPNKPKSDSGTKSAGGGAPGMSPTQPGDGLGFDEDEPPADDQPKDVAKPSEARPDEAKATQGPPVNQAREQAEEHCPLICSLSEGTCELATEICSLADRHPDDEEYVSACERATNDCELAKEACLECLG